MFERTRHALLHVLDPAGRPLGTFACVATLPFLQETSDLLARARDAGLELVVLRLVEHRVDDASATIHAVYLAEALSPPPAGALAPAAALLPLDDHPLRVRHARLGELRRDFAWADEQLAALPAKRSGPPEQQRTWNLSSVSRLPLVGGDSAWLKVVPSFFAHEGTMIETITALEHRGGVRSRFERQLFFVPHVNELMAAGAIDRRGPAFLAAATTLCARDDVRETLSADTRAKLDALIDALPQLLDDIDACGLPDTIVHGDLTPGNVIGSADGAFLLDWGEVAVGLPLLDVPGLSRTLGPTDTQRLRDAVVAFWSAHRPTADVKRALALSPIVLELSAALVYQRFLDNIEPLERHYHCDDVAPRLAAAVAHLRDR
jgi:hypothetical protein